MQNYIANFAVNFSGTNSIVNLAENYFDCFTHGINPWGSGTRRDRPSDPRDLVSRVNQFGGYPRRGTMTIRP